MIRIWIGKLIVRYITPYRQKNNTVHSNIEVYFTKTYLKDKLNPKEGK